MIFIYIFIAAIFGSSALAFTSRYSSSRSVITFTAAISVLISILLSQTYVVPYYLAATFRYTVVYEDPDIATIKNKYPAEFEEYVGKAKHSILARQENDYLLMIQLDFLNNVLMKTLRYASYESIYNYLANQIALDKKLYLIDPALVIYFEFSHSFTRVPVASLVVSLSGNQLIEDSLQAKEDVILSAIAHPDTTPITPAQKQEAISHLTIIIKHVNDIYGQDALINLIKNPNSPAIDISRSAEAFIMYNSLIYARGITMSGLIFHLIAPDHPSP